MMRDDRNQVPPHPDTVAYLEGRGEEGAPVDRTREGGHTRHLLQNDEAWSLQDPEDRPHEGNSPRCRRRSAPSS